MFLVEVHVTVATGHRPSDDEITDLIDSIVDDLDELDLEPSVGTCRFADDVRVTVGVIIDKDEEFDALTAGVAAVRAALHAAGIGTAGFPMSRDLHLRVSPQPA